MQTGERSILVAAGHGRAARLAAGESVRIGLPEGPQVADLFAFAAADLGECLSTEHTRSCIERLAPRLGDFFYSSRRRPMLRLVEDSSPGVHDMLLSACDRQRYALLGHAGPHRSCADNLREALAALELVPPEIPSPLNLFQNVAVAADGTLAIRPPLAARGDSVVLEAAMDLVLVVSACPMDIAPTNGADRTPRAISVQHLGRKAAAPAPAALAAG